VPGYEVLGVLGRGAMGVVYKARHIKLNRLVALKMILSGAHASEQELARFRSEAEAVARLQHPEIVQIYEIGEHQGLPYFSLEFVDGGSVQQHLAGTPQPPGAAAQLLEPLARAVHAAHQRGIVHRDLKPANVLLTRDGAPKVSDFGLAKQLDADSGRTQSGAILGTPSYMAPEQAAGRSKEVGPLADVWALGAILYETLTGSPPFRGATVRDTLEQVCTQDPVPPRRLQPKVPRDLETICLKCLHKEPQGRYGSAEALAEDLGRWQRGEPVLAQPPSLGYLLGKFVRRYRVPLGAATVVLLAGVVGVVAAFVQISAAYDREKTANEDAQQKAQVANTALGRETEARLAVQKALADLEARQSQLARSFCEVSDREFRSGNVQDSVNWMLRAYEVAPVTDTLRASYRHLLAGQGRLLEKPLGHEGKVWAVTFSPDGQLAMTGSEDGTARLWHTATGRPVGQPLRHDGWVFAVAFSPNGRLALTGSGDVFKRTGEARFWDTATGKAVGQPLRPEGLVRRVAFSADGQLVLTSGGDDRKGEARVWATATGQPVGQPLRHEGSLDAAAFSPDGRLVLTGSHDKTARLWEAATGKPVGQPLRHGGVVYAVAFSPDGRLALTGSMDRTARLWETATGQPVGQPFRHGDSVGAVVFSPDGRLALTASLDGTARLWETATGRPVGQPLRHGGWVDAVAFSPDGRLALTGSRDHTAMLRETATGRPVAQPLSHDAEVVAVAFSPDGRWALTGSWDHTARLWDMAAVQPVGQPFRHRAGVGAVAFSPDGRLALTGSMDRTARLWNTATGRAVGLPFRHTDAIMTVAFSSDGRLALTGTGMGGTKGEVRLWDVATAHAIATVRHEGHVWAVAFSPDGQLVLTGGDDKTARLWEAATGKPVGQPLRHGGLVSAVAFSPDGRLALTGCGDHTAQLWEVATGKPVNDAFRHGGLVSAVAFSPDGRLALTGSGDGMRGEARVWETATGRAVGPPLRHEGFVKAVAFSPDGRLALTGSYDNTARLWEVSRGHRVATLRHEGKVWAVAFSPDGRLALTGSWDNTARLWETATGRPVGQPFRHGDAVLAVAFSPDGRLALTGSDDQTARLWEISPPAPEEPRRLSSWVHVHTRKAFNDQGVLQDLREEEWLRACRDLDSNGGDWEKPPDPQRWHLTHAADAEAAENWFAATFHLRRLLDKAPEDVDLLHRLGTAHANLKEWREAIAVYDRILAGRPEEVSTRSERARAYAELQQWDQALADWQQVLQSRHDDSSAWYGVGLVYLSRQDLAAYRNQCRRMLVHFGRTQDTSAANAAALLTVLMPDAVQDRQTVLRLAEIAYRSAPDRLDFQHTLGAALCRAGHYAEAVRRLQESARKQRNGISVRTHLFLAMASYRLAQLDASTAAVGLAAALGPRPLRCAAGLLPGLAAARARLEALLRQTPPASGWEDGGPGRHLIQEGEALLHRP
jgi:WD40 repeat protein/tetratricopeptide (TPR) repeat protein/tRNA A-37 threonylcarbamoyl transferase component Bud32